MTTDRLPRCAGREPACGLWHTVVLPCLAAAILAGAAAPARAADGCLVMLCFAAADWRKVAQCVPPVRQVLRDLARGRSFPTCAMSGTGSSAQHSWAEAPVNCPPQYTHRVESDAGSYHTCDFTGAVSVVVDGAPFARTWWNTAGDTVTEFSAAAKAQLGTWDRRYDDEHQAWAASQAASQAAAPVVTAMP